MRVVIRADVASDEASLFALNSILRKIEEGWHVWEVTDPEALEGSVFLKQNRIFEEMHKHAAKRSAYPISGDIHRIKVIVTLDPNEDHELSPDIADKYLKNSLKVLMENCFSDGKFLDSLLHILAPREMTALIEINPSPLEKVGAGGVGQLTDLVDVYIRQSQKSGFPARIVVFTESDARYPGDTQKEAKKVEEKCATLKVPCLILKKRTIENYIPDEAFDSWCIPTNYEGQSWLRALKKLGPLQRDHYPLKGGFSKLDKRGWTDEEKQLYDTVTEDDKNTLKSKLMKDPIDLLTSESSSLTAEAFRRRDRNGELDSLVKMIANNL